MKLLSRITILALMLFVGVSCSDDDDGAPPVQDLPNLVEAAQSAGLTTLLDAVGAVDGLDQTLLDAQSITVFAPSNLAFENALAAFGANDLNELVDALGGVEQLETVLGYHVVPATAFALDLAEGDQVFTTLSGQDITVNRTGNDVSITDSNGNVSNVTLADVQIENGVVHVIDAVLLPELPSPTLVEAAQDAGLTTLLDAIGAVDGLDQALLDADAITVFAPDNDAFADALTAFGVSDLNGLVDALGGVEQLETVLGFHVVPAVAFSTDLQEGEQTFPTLSGQDITVTKTGNAVSVTDAEGNVRNVTTADVEIDNGVVHVIDGVLLPTL
jgi:transforming growth factor-beta-induced protein